ncbi:hypothetical protein SNOG_04087 [Parastagonospora nodorum SN15]|uniref:Uncharacterized protein n=1 Tax=Phaeosphaeria nodorum (strain SN15 / ATCC MYA-4574 / FGSC 10173) TaxID=321614 RepID=Q0UVX7_PHANO|nr:hypothetical protein SNOG_04087 [Parastagonospora nodorum SN15]EAT87847.1 hypothetical protein SNOG_04087 [Parastagonospora nodorum SN15]
MSKHAVWWSHFWEAPWFVTNDAGTIRNTFLDRSIVMDKNHLGQDIPRPFSANVLGLLNSNEEFDTDLPEDGGNPKEYQSMYDTAATSRAGKAAIELWAEYGTEPKARLQWPTLPGQYNPVGPLPVPLGPGTFSNIQASSLVSVILRSSSRSTSTMITSASFAGLRPGFNGVPGCAYVMAPESGQRCVEDYCNCGESMIKSRSIADTPLSPAGTDVQAIQPRRQHRTPTPYAIFRDLALRHKEFVRMHIPRRTK